MYTMARILIISKHYNRAHNLIVSRKLHTHHLGCCYLAAKALQLLGNDRSALDLLESIETEKLIEQTMMAISVNSDDFKTRNLLSSLYCLKGQILECIENRELAAESYKLAVQTDAFCYEAFQALIDHQMLTADEEKNLINSINDNDGPEHVLVKGLYSLNLKKYECPENLSFPSELAVFEKNCDVRVCMAERFYYNCDHVAAYKITCQIMHEDPLHHRCIPLHVALLVDMKKTNDLFKLAHSLVDFYPEWSIAWYAL